MWIVLVCTPPTRFMFLSLQVDGEGAKDGTKGEAALATFFSNLLMKPGTGSKGAGMRPGAELKKPPKPT